MRLLLLLLVVPLFGFGQIRSTLYDADGNVLQVDNEPTNDASVVNTHEPVRGFKIEFQGFQLTEKIIDDSNTDKINYYGNWHISDTTVVGPDPGNSCYCSWSQSQNDSLTYAFTGFTKLEWYGEQMAHHGLVDVYFDNVFQEQIDTYSPDNLSPVINWSIDNLNPDAVHKFKLVAPMERNPASTGASVVNQFLRVSSDPPVEPPVEPPIPTIPWTIENTSNEFEYFGEWSHEDATGCACSYAKLQTDSVVHVFKGARRIEWWGMKQSTDGKANVYLDGVFQETVDTYAPGRTETTLNWSKSGLDPTKEHHFRIVVTGTRNPASTGHHIVMRYLKFFPDDEPPPIEPPPTDPNNPATLANGIIVLASSYEINANRSNLPAQSMDGDLDTKWSAEGDNQWIQYELSEIVTMESLTLSTMSYNGERTYTFDLKFGNDGVNWDATIVDQQISTTDEKGTAKFDFPDIDARFLRIVGHGNTVNEWNHVTEAGISIKVVIPPDPPPIDPPPEVSDCTDCLYNIIREGRYQVFQDGVQHGGEHNEFTKAIEHAMQVKALNPLSSVIIKPPIYRIDNQ